MPRRLVTPLLLGLTPVLLAFSAGSALANSPPVVSNVVAVQVTGTGQVRVTFNVTDADGDQVTARLICSSNNGGSFDLLPVSVSGDANHAMPAGTGKVIIWNAAADYPGRTWPQVVAKVYVSDGPSLAGEMVLVPAGQFRMGRDPATGSSFPDSPAHYVTLDAYYIDKYEVTNAEFKQFIDAGGYSTQAFWSAEGWTWKNNLGRTTPEGFSAALPGYPVYGTSWYEAEAYCNFVGKRLPTEAEWEKAARGTDERSFPWGEGVSDALANIGGLPFNTAPSPVGYYDGSTHTNPVFETANGRGPYETFDQAGNVCEWVNDWHADYSAASVSNPKGPSTGAYRVVRGGDCNPNGWRTVLGLTVAGALTSHTRLAAYPTATTTPGYTSTFVLLGFRCAKSAP